MWREVRDTDLGPDLDAAAWLAARMEARGQTDAIGLLTSRNVACFTTAEAGAGQAQAAACATVGLSNAERIGQRRGGMARAGTINVVCAVDAALSEAAQIEALSIAVEARTAAVLEVGLGLDGGRATGTGTDCLVLACPPGTAAYAGTHTDVGEAVGRTVYDAVFAGATEWIAASQPKTPDGPGDP